jgi:exo-beta-1,3-glucanase (GH17 family)
VSTEFHIRLNRRDISIDEVIEDLRRVASALESKSVTKVQYDELGIFGATTILRKLETWNKALEKSGLEVVNRQDITQDELFKQIANVWSRVRTY